MVAEELHSEHESINYDQDGDVIIVDVPDYERTRQATLRNTESSVPATRYNLRGHRSN